MVIFNVYKSYIVNYLKCINTICKIYYYLFLDEYNSVSRQFNLCNSKPEMRVSTIH